METNDSIEVTFTVTRSEAEAAFDEATALLKTHVTAAPADQMAQFRLVYRLALGSAFVLIFTSCGVPLRAAILAAIPLSLATVQITFQVAADIRLRAARTNFIETTAPVSDVITEQLAVINPDGVRKQSRNLSMTFSWPYVREIALTKGNVIFAMDPNQAPNILYIPRRAFPSEIEAKAFVEMALEFKRLAPGPKVAKQ